MITKMGVKHPDLGNFHDARRKFRTVVLAVIATVRMQRVKEQWDKARKLGEGLRRAKGEVLKRRETQRRAGPV
jgi:Pericentrin-AKAP-450 domain of centrosomal targeting protein